MTKPKQSIRHASLAHLIDHENNRKLDEATVAEMVESVREHGVLTPLVVTEHPLEVDRWLLLDGHHRAAAAKEAGLATVPVVVRHGLDEDVTEQLVVMLVANCQRKDLEPMERAEQYGRLRARGLTAQEIGRRTGTQQGTVSYFLSLLELDAESQARVRNKTIPVRQAVDAIREHRAQQRKTAGTAQPGRGVVVQPSWLNKRHVLARKVAELCTHKERPRVGDVGCGQCWEQIIRADERVPDELGAN